jgi:nitrite reductase [NAD(P)H] small subunit
VKRVDEEREVTEWVRVGRLDDIPRRGARVVTWRGTDIALFRTSDDQVFALRDRCPHRQGKLSQGIVHGTAVTCPLHNWVIGLDDGLARDPDTGCVDRFAVRRTGEDILLAGTPGRTLASGPPAQPVDQRAASSAGARPGGPADSGPADSGPADSGPAPPDHASPVPPAGEPRVSSANTAPIPLAGSPPFPIAGA